MLAVLFAAAFCLSINCVVFGSFPTMLLGQSIRWDRLLGEGREYCSGTAARNSWENEHREQLTHCLPTSVARASRMLLDKHHLCGHTLFYELSHQTGWLLKCCWFSRQHRTRSEDTKCGSSGFVASEPGSFAKGDRELTIMEFSYDKAYWSIWNLLKKKRWGCLHFLHIISKICLIIGCF